MSGTRPKGIPVGIVRTATANLASVLAGLRRAGAAPFFVETQEQILSLPKIVLPGVGAFGAAMAQLTQSGMIAPLQERLKAGKATFGICLGLQILCRASEESPDVEGLGLLDAVVTRFDAELRVPQFGWSPIVPPAQDDPLFQPGYAYFANSYSLSAEAARAEGWDVATAEYGRTYVAAMRKGDVVACQCHPELSGRWGHELLSRWCHTKTQGA